MTPQDVLVVGESLVDVVRRAGEPPAVHPGGSAANVAVALARLGHRVAFATALADDDHGAMVADHLATNDVRLAGSPFVLERTSSAVATIGADGSADYEFDIAWRLGEADLPVAPGAVHVCSIGAVLEPGADQVLELVRRIRPSATVSYDVNARPSVTGCGPEVVARVEALVSLADLVKLSDEDLGHHWSERTEADVVAELLDRGPRALVVTRGAAGASWYDARGRIDVASAPVEVADTIGAGDTFAAGLLDDLAGIGALGGRLPALSDGDVRRLLHHAAACAAVTVSRPGADPPRRADL